MDPQIDTAQQRAERILAMHQMNEVRAGYRVQVHDALVEALQQTSRDALAEAVLTVVETPLPDNARDCCRAFRLHVLNRLREGVK